MNKEFLIERFKYSKELFDERISSNSDAALRSKNLDSDLLKSLDTFDSVRCACFIANKLKGRAEVYGFFRGDNPIVSNANVISENQHYFAVVDKRFIVDLWLHYEKGESELVYDLQDHNDKIDIISRYGNPRLWSWLSHEGFVSPYSKHYPINKRLELKRQENNYENSVNYT